MELKARHWDRRNDGGLTLTEIGFGAAPLGYLYKAISDEAKPGAYFNYDPAPADIIARVNAIEAVCKDPDERMVDAAFQFPLLHPAHVSVIPGEQGVSEMNGNLSAAQADIPPEHWADLKSKELLREDAPI